MLFNVCGNILSTSILLSVVSFICLKVTASSSYSFLMRVMVFPSACHLLALHNLHNWLRSLFSVCCLTKCFINSIIIWSRCMHILDTVTIHVYITLESLRATKYVACNSINILFTHTVIKIDNGNSNEWCRIRSVIIQVINKIELP